MTARRKVAILISGRGSNMRALIEAAAQEDYPAEIVVVVSNRADAAGLQSAKQAGIATAIVPHGDYADRAAFDAAIDAELHRRGVEIVCLAGFMRLLTPGFVAAWRDRMINIHPSLLPAFRGLHTHRRALEAGVEQTGCSVHFVRSEVDTGPVIARATVPVLAGDTEDTLAARVLEQEHVIYPQALRLVIEGRAAG